MRPVSVRRLRRSARFRITKHRDRCDGQTHDDIGKQPVEGSLFRRVLCGLGTTSLDGSVELVPRLVKVLITHPLASQ